MAQNRQQIYKPRNKVQARRVAISIKVVKGPDQGKVLDAFYTPTYRERGENVIVQINRHQFPDTWKKAFKKNAVSITLSVIDDLRNSLIDPVITVKSATINCKDQFKDVFEIETRILERG